MFRSGTEARIGSSTSRLKRGEGPAGSTLRIVTMPTLRMFPSAHAAGAVAKLANAIKAAPTKNFFMLTSSQIDAACPVLAGSRQRTIHSRHEQPRKGPLQA